MSAAAPSPRTGTYHWIRTALLAAAFVSPAAVGPVSSRSPLPAERLDEAAAARMSGALRTALRSARRAPALISLESASTEARAAAREAMEGIARNFVVGEDADGSVSEEAPVRFKAILDSDDPSAVSDLVAAGARIRGRVGRAVSFDAPLGAAESLARARSLLRLDIARRMKPELDVSAPEVHAPEVWDPNGPFDTRGAGVLVAVMDSGHDLKHLDFRTPDSRKKTRFLSAYTMAKKCAGTPPPGHAQGCYYDQRRINRYLRGRAKLSYRDPPALEGHGSHVLGIAAGNGRAARKGTKKNVFVGVAPEASLLGVKLFNDNGAFVGDITEALQYLGEEQARQGDLPLVVNMSLGHQFGAHDGSDPDEVAIDAFIDEGTTLGTPRVVVKSAGNAALDGVHVGGVASTSTTRTVSFTVPGGSSCTPFRGSGNDLFVADLWYEGDVELSVTVIDPNGANFFSNTTGNNPNSVEVDTPSGTIFVDCPAAPNPVNNARECVLGVDDSGGVAPRPGTWTVEIDGVTIPMAATGTFDAWVGLVGRGNCVWGWNGPTGESSISIPGTSQKGLTVGAYVTKVAWLNIDGDGLQFNPAPTLLDLADFSSHGPTRDGRVKPDLVAPGFAVASVLPRTLPKRDATLRLFITLDGKHVINLGTSMSAPHVAGAAALLLSLDPTLTEAEVRGLLVSNASAFSIPFSVVLPDNAWGAGRLDVEAAAAAIP